MFPAAIRRTGKLSRRPFTPAFVEGEVQKLLGAVETSTHTGLRDRALLGVLAYTFARIGAVVNLKVEDFYPSGKRFLLRFKFKEKGGKEKELPVHHKLEELLDQYFKATGLEKEQQSPFLRCLCDPAGPVVDFRRRLATPIQSRDSGTVDKAPSFRRAFAKRRCLIPADGFYEWRKTTRPKLPFAIAIVQEYFARQR